MSLFHHHRKDSGVTLPDPTTDPGNAGTADSGNAPAPADPGTVTPGTTDPGNDVSTAPDPRDAVIAQMQARLDQMQAQINAQQAAAQAAVSGSQETPPIGLKSGSYTPNDDVQLVVWEKGDPPPDGFSVVVTSNGTRLAVKNDATGQVVRDPDGNAYSVHEGTALAVHGDGHFEYLTDPDDVAFFSRRFKEAGQ